MIKSLYNILKNRCPNCHIGPVFADKSFFFSLGFPKMHSHCSHCHVKFEKEPGYFFGAMFVNYGLTVGEGISTYLLASLFFEEAFDQRILVSIASVILLLTFFNIRFSRMLWMYALKNYAT